jgi:fatty-acyl-CoA synthase
MIPTDLQPGGIMQAGDLLSNRVRLTPDREALLELETDRRFTYAELNSRTNRVANFLRQEFGVGEGDRVSILAHNSVAYIDLMYAVAKIGAIFAPLNWRLVARELAYIINDCEPKVLLCGPEFVDLLEEMRPNILVEHYLKLDGAELAGAASYEEGLQKASDEEPERPSIDGETPHCILYTSGTTGRPKGAVIPHRQVIWNCINTAVSWGLSQSDVAPIFTPMFHAGGLFVTLAPLFFLGGRIVLAKDFDPDESLRIIANEKCTMVLGVPTLFQLWMNSPLFDEVDFSHVRFFISGGAPCPVELMETWRNRKGIVFRQGYGLTEAGTNCFSMTDEQSVEKAGTVGKPIFNSEIRLVDEEGEAVPPEHTGSSLLMFVLHTVATLMRLQMHYEMVGFIRVIWQREMRMVFTPSSDASKT